jgi:hypothetical protein
MKKQHLLIGATAVFLFAGMIGCNKMVINVPADRIYVVQTPGGTMYTYTQPGWQNQHLGDHVGDYPKFESVDFDVPEQNREDFTSEKVWEGDKSSMYGIKVVFNDNGTAYLFGTVPVEMPMDRETILAIQEKHGSWEAFREKIIRKQIISSVTQVGSLMTSREANAERRSDLIGYIEDMVRNGLYQTRVKSMREADALTKDTVVVKYAERIDDTNAPGGFRRQAPSEIAKYNVKIGTPAIRLIVFSPAVQDQLTKQQEMTMAIATSKAEALVAQQNAKTAAADAESRIAKVQAERNAEKEKAVIDATQRKEVAELDMKAAEFEKRRSILQGEGEAEKKRLLMSADGALNPKLDAWLESQKAWAAAWKENGAAITPTFLSGGAGSGSNGSMQTFIELMGVKAANDLGLDMKMKK